MARGLALLVLGVLASCGGSGGPPACPTASEEPPVPTSLPPPTVAPEPRKPVSMEPEPVFPGPRIQPREPTDMERPTIAPEPPTLDWVPAEDCFAVQVAVGGRHACALTDLGHVYCWGDDESYQLGVLEVDETCSYGTMTLPCSHTPVPVAGLKDVVELSLTNTDSCALDDAGVVRCWGLIQSGLTPVPTVLAGIDHAVSIGGWGVRAAVELSGAVKGWIAHMGSTPTPVPDVNDAVQTDFTCALGATGRVQCWWCNDRGQRGDGTLAPPQQVGVASNCQLTTSTVAFEGRAVQVTSGYQHACLIDDVGAVHCWGDNQSGQLGVPPTDTPLCNYGSPCATSPLPMAGVDDAVQVAGGLSFTCVLHEEGAVSCTASGVQVPIDLPAPAVQLSARYWQSCAVLSDGRVFCWSPGNPNSVPEAVALCGA